MRNCSQPPARHRAGRPTAKRTGRLPGSPAGRGATAPWR
jgi:hypothetical protein